MPGVSIPECDLREMLVYACRYCQHRRSYANRAGLDMLARYGEHLSPNDVAAIRTSLSEDDWNSGDWAIALDELSRRVSS